MSNEGLIKYLHSLLKDVQKTMFSAFYKSTSRKYVIHSSRRLGKTYLLVILSCIVALSKANAQVRYASVTQKAVRKMIHPIFKDVFKDVSTKLKPTWNTQEGAYIFPNGSFIHICGVNGGNADDLRGTAADLCVVDEAAFIDELSYLVDSVLLPQLLTIKGSKLIMASSSPLSPAHEFVNYIQEAREKGSYSSYDIHQGGYTKDVIHEFCKEAGGEQSTTWRREYLNEIITDSQFAIVPEYTKDLIHEYSPDELDKYYHRYVSMDIGTKDFTAILFGIYDFKKATLYITRESVISGPEVTTANIATLVKQGESSVPAYRRVADNNNLILLQDLQTLHDISFYPTNKDSLVAMVNELRLWVQSKRIKISPTCKQLLGCLEFGVWSKDRKDWGRSNQYGHYDALASLMYLVRNIDQSTNPIPFTHATNFNHYIPYDEEQDVQKNVKKIFNLS